MSKVIVLLMCSFILNPEILLKAEEIQDLEKTTTIKMNYNCKNIENNSNNDRKRTFVIKKNRKIKRGNYNFNKNKINKKI